MPTVLVLFAAAALSVLLHFVSPLANDDPFRGTLTCLPLVVAGFWAISSQAAREGGRRPGRRRTVIRVALLALLLLLVTTRDRLGLGGAGHVLAAALVLLLADHVSHQLLRLRPLLGQNLPRTPSWLFLLLPLVSYLAIQPWVASQRQPDGDEPWHLLITYSLAYDLDADLTNNYQRGDSVRFMDRAIEPQPGDPRGPGGETYSRHNILLPAVLAPAFRIAGRPGALAMMALMSAALAWMTLRLCCRFVPDHPGEALWAYAIAAFAPPLLLYSSQVWVEVPAALLCAVALDRARDLGEPAGATRKGWLVFGLALLLLPLLKIRFAILAGSLVVLAIWHTRHDRRIAGLLAAAAGAGGLGVLLLNWSLYGNPLKIHTWRDLEIYRRPITEYIQHLVGLLFDLDFGLFATAPIWCLLLPAGLLLWRRRPAVVLDLAVFSLPYLVFVASRREWFGGWSPPFRYGLVVLPALAVTLVPLLATRRAGAARAVLVALSVATIVLTVIWIVLPGWTYNLADGRSHLVDYLEVQQGADIARFLPSYVRPRTASWIWPPVILLLVTCLWWRPRRPVRQAAPWAAAFLGLMLALVPVAARSVPSRTIEAEASYIAKTGGHRFPQRWMIERVRFHDGWKLYEGDSLSAPVVPGGDLAQIELYCRFERHRGQSAHLRIRLGEGPAAELDLDRDAQWQRLTVGPLPAGEHLTVAIDPPPNGPFRNGVVIDHIRLHWQ